MKKRKKLSIAVLLLFLAQLVFGVNLSKEVKAAEVDSSVPQFLEARKETLDFAIQYKNKTLVNNAVIIDYNIKLFVEENGQKHVISDDFNILRYLSPIGIYNDCAYLVSEQSGKKSIYKADLNTYKLEYVKDVPKYGKSEVVVSKIDASGILWYEADEHNIPFYDAAGRIVDYNTKYTIFNDKGFLYESIKLQKGDSTFDRFGNLQSCADGTMWFSKSLKQGADNKLYRISKDNTIKEYSINSANPIRFIYPGAENTILVGTEQYNKDSNGNYSLVKTIVQKYKVNGDTLQLLNEKDLGNANIYTSSDIDGGLWINQDGVISKFQDNEFVKKYIVQSHMKALDVYDDKHLVACGIVGFGYTPISIDEPKTDNTNTNTGVSTDKSGNINNNTSSNTDQSGNTNNNASTNINKSSQEQTPVVEKFTTAINSNKAILTLDPKQTLKDSVNEIISTLPSGVQAVETKIDVASINGGKGSLKVSANNVALELPFSTIDFNGTSNGDFISVIQNVVLKDSSLNSLKSIGKLYDFSLSSNKHDGTKIKDMHQFKNGKAKISVKLTDSEINGLDTAKLAAFYYNESTKQWENVGGSYNKETKTFTFETSHFSEYTIAEVNGTLPKTGSLIDFEGLMLIAIAFLLVGSRWALGKRKVEPIRTFRK